MLVSLTLLDKQYFCQGHVRSMSGKEKEKGIREMKGQGKLTAPLSANVNVLSATFRNTPACWYHANITLGGGKQ